MERFMPPASASSCSGTSPRQGRLASGQHSQSTLAGHVLSARDRRTPVGEARLILDTVEVRARADGQYELSLDALPMRVELRVVAKGFHPHYEVLDWATVASGGLLLRDYFLTPSDMPVPAHGRSARMPVSLEAPAVRDDFDLEEGEELELEEGEELELLDGDEEFWEEEEPDGWGEGDGDEDPFESVSMAWDGRDDLDAEIELSMDPVPGPPRVLRFFRR